MKVKLIKVTENSKLGPMATSMTEQASCPDACPLKKAGCYADYGPLNWTWRKVANEGMEWAEFCEALHTIPRGRMFRHNQAGDLPGKDNKLDTSKCLDLAIAASHLRGFSYTHYPATDFNVGVLMDMANFGFVTNLSADTLEEADELVKTGLPVVVLLAKDHKGNTVTPAGNKVVVCPHYSTGVQCIDCKLCAVQNRSSIVGFPAHGPGKNRATKVSLGI